MRKYINRKTILFFTAIFIVATSLYYTGTLAGKLAEEEKRKVQQVADAIRTSTISNNEREIEHAFNTITENTTIPLIQTDSKGKIISYKNIDTTGESPSNKFILKKLNEFTTEHAPIVIDLGQEKSCIYYGDTYLLKQLRYYPYIQLTIIVLFLIVLIVALTSSYKALQNQVWVGLSKETAHQLGTPLSSIEGWLELLRETDAGNEAVVEMQKDLDRLKLVADRFSKVGSEPNLVEEDLNKRLSDMVGYMQKRSPNRVKITFHEPQKEVLVNISGPLFDWVIENLIRNALDAMEGVGTIDLFVENTPQHVHVDVQDTGKGMPKSLVNKIFTPGFTTKKRGWGLGLSLSKRIIEKYHHGSLFVKHSEIGKGTTFRIILRR